LQPSRNRKRREEYLMDLIRVNDLNFHQHTKDHDSIIITFSAKWCGKCKLLKPRLKQLARESNDAIGYFEAFIEDSSNLRERLEIEHVPTTLALEKGQVISKTHKIEKSIISKMTENFKELV